MPEPTNEELVAQYQSGDESAFEELLQRYQPFVCKYAYDTAHRAGCLHICDDLIAVGQEALARAATTYNSSKAAFGTYVYRSVMFAIRQAAATATANTRRLVSLDGCDDFVEQERQRLIIVLEAQ